VTNFPVLVRLTNASNATGGDVLAAAKAGGADIRFSDSAGTTPLAYEIERWSSSAAEIWVKVPTINGNATTTIKMYWGKADSNTTSSGSAVFGSNNFLGVWHMGNASGATPRPNAAAPGTNDMVPGGPAPAELTPKVGLIGLADSLRGQGNQAEGDHFSAGSITYPNQQVTMSMWMYYPSTQPSAGWTHFMAIGNASSSHALWFGRVGDTQNWRARGAGGTAGTGAGTTGETDLSENTTVTDGLLPQDAWAHLAVTRDSAEGRRWRMYKNGERLIDYYRGEGTTSSTFARHNFPAIARSTTFIGRSIGWNDVNPNIIVDEARISSVARSADWIKLEHATQKAGATAVVLGSSLPNQPRPLFYSNRNASYLINSAILPNTPTVDGTLSGANPFSIDVPLPAGLTFNTATGVISGTPTALKASTRHIISVSLTGPSTGLDTVFIAVTVGDPPGAPTGVSATATSGQAVVTWAAPATTGGSPITSYVIRAVNDTAKTCTWTTGPLTCTITGLTNGTSYTFTARAVNAAGSSPVSAASAAVTPAGVASAPTNVTAVQAGTAASVTVSWTLPASNGGSPIVEYYANGSPGGICYAPAPGSGTTASCVATGLTFGQAYTFTVYAVNGIGNSPLSSPSNSVTPVGLANSFAIQVSGMVKPYTFALTEDAMKSTEALTMSITDIKGRTVWSKTINPSQDRVREVTWNGLSSKGNAVSAGVYMVRLSAVTAGKTSDVVRPTVK